MAKPHTTSPYEILNQLHTTNPKLFDGKSEYISSISRNAVSLLFSSLKPYCPKSPFEGLLTEGFDAEQIWQQTDLQTASLVSNLKKEVNKFAAKPGQLKRIFPERKLGNDDVGNDDDDDEEEEEEGFDEDQMDMSGEEGEEESGGDDDHDHDNDEEEEEYSDDCGIQDKFLKVKDLEKYLEDEEAREYGIVPKKRGGGGKKKVVNDDEDEDEEGDDDDEEEEFEGFGDYDGDDNEDDDEDGADIRYDDFYGSDKKGRLSKKKNDGEEKFEGPLSTHEKQLQKKRDEIEQMEKENIGPKNWTMMGEVPAIKREMNSALEIEIDYDNNANPPPETTVSDEEEIEDIIQKHIEIKEKMMKERLESNFIDRPRKAKETKELDENKSKKGLTEIFENESMQKKPGFVPNAEDDKLDKEITSRMRELRFILSQFNYKPKPIIEDMTIESNVPVIAMEEVMPVAVSHESMLAPEEVFASKGYIKEDVELTRDEKRRRRAGKKRKYKAEATIKIKRTPVDPLALTHSEVKED